MLNYKSATVLIFVVLMLLVCYLIFAETRYGLLIMGLIVPVLVVAQTWVVLTAGEKVSREYEDGAYEKD